MLLQRAGNSCGLRPQAPSPARSALPQRSAAWGHQRWARGVQHQRNKAPCLRTLAHDDLSASELVPSARREPFATMDDVQPLFEDGLADLINHLEEYGVKKLGSFRAKAGVVKRLMGDDDMLTMGSDKVNMPVSEWQNLLEAERKVNPGDDMGMDDYTMDAYVVPIQDAASADEQGLLRHMVRQYMNEACPLEVFGLPAMQAVINYKWNAYARNIMLLQLGVYLIWLAAFTVFTFLYQAEVLGLTLPELLATTSGKIEIACLGISVVMMLPFALNEVTQVAAYGLSTYGQSYWNMVDVASYIGQIAIAFIHTSARELTQNLSFQALVAAQVIIMYLKLQYFTRVFHPERPSLVDTMATVFKDLGNFIFFYCMVIWMFGLAFSVLFRFDQAIFEDFSNVWHSMVATFSSLTEGLDYKAFLEASNPVLLTSVYIIFQFVMVMVLSNLILGFVVDGVSKAQEQRGLKQLMTKASLVDEIDAFLPDWLEKRLNCFPPYVHVLKADVKLTDAVKLNSDWPIEGVEEYSMSDEDLKTNEQAWEAEAAKEAAAAGGSGVGREDMKLVLEKLQAVEAALKEQAAQNAALQASLQALLAARGGATGTGGSLGAAGAL